MSQILLRVTYRLRAHHVSEFETIFEREIMPLVREFRLDLAGMWRTSVGEIGEYMELWRFDSVADYEARFKKLLDDPRLQKIFERTGPMVEEERFSILDPVVLEPEA